MPSGSGGILNKRLKFVELIELLNTFTKVFLPVNTSYKDLTTLVIFYLNVDKQKPVLLGSRLNSPLLQEPDPK